MVKRIVGSMALVLIIGLVSHSPVLANGGKAKSFHLTGELEEKGANGGYWAFTAQGDPITFYLATVNNKYHVFAIRGVSEAKSPLKLSKDEDTVEIEFESSPKIKGILNLASSDRATWDGLDAKMREEVVYPPNIPPDEEEGIYVYIPVAALKNQRNDFEIPRSITYTIKSLGQHVVLRRPSAKK